MRHILAIAAAISLTLCLILHFVCETLLPTSLHQNVGHILGGVADIAVILFLILPKTRRWGGLCLTSLVLVYACLQFFHYHMISTQAVTDYELGVLFLINCLIMATGLYIWLGDRENFAETERALSQHETSRPTWSRCGYIKNYSVDP